MIVALVMTGLACVEYAHFGQVSDRQGTWPVNNVNISQQQSDGSWKDIGVTDGKGRWNILKARISGGGRVKLHKPGYYTVLMSESEFLQQSNILMQSDDESSYRSENETGWGTQR